MENYRPENPRTVKKPFSMKKVHWIILAIVVVIVLFFAAFRPVYILKGLGQQEMGVKIRAGEVVDIVGPGGVYSDFGLYVKMENYKIEGVKFQVEDDEVFTKDMQPVFVEIRGQVFRPTLTSLKTTGTNGSTVFFTKDEIARNFVNYRQLFTDDEALLAQMDGFGRQAMKVCVGQNDLRGNAVAEGRDILRNCIESELEKLAQDIGLYVNNIVVTDVQASEQAMVIINETNQYLLDAEKAKAQSQKLEQEGKANAVQKEAEIRVQQAAAQETARQKVVLAQLEEQELIANRAVIDAERQNAILEQDLNKEKAIAAEELAKADLAQTILLAQVYQDNPAYFQYLVAQINASAIKETDKVMILPQGTIPQLVLGDSIVPTYSVQEPSVTGIE